MVQYRRSRLCPPRPVARPSRRSAAPPPAPGPRPAAGALHLVSTPIGNLEDVTLRALRILREADLIAAEDTRRTARLLNHYGIDTATTSFHEHNEHRKTARILQRLAGGDSVALVADAGTPLLSDPGARLVRDALDGGFKVHPAPGPSAVLGGLVMSGLGGGPFTFAGFPPNRSKARKEWISRLAVEPRPVVIFESPHRVKAALTDMATALGNRKIAVCREMTKMHEELINGQIKSVIEQIVEPRGEYTIVVAPPEKAPGDGAGAASNETSDRLWNYFCKLTDKMGCDRRLAIRILADRYGVPRSTVYSIVRERNKFMSYNR